MGIRVHSIRSLLLAGLLFAGVKVVMGQQTLQTATTAATSAGSPAPKPAALHEHPTLVAMWQRNNQLRASVGRLPMALSPTLTKAAQDHAWYMARTGQFSHDSNGGMASRVRRYGGTHGSMAENIAWNQQNVVGVFQSWQNSSGHWSNICSSQREAGFGYAVGPGGQTYWVAVYGTP